MGEVMDRKVFGKYHDLALLFVGFFLTSVLGGFLGAFFSNWAWERQRNTLLIASEKESASRFFEEISRLMDRRIYRMRLFHWRLNSRDEGEITSALQAYRAALYDWNDSLNRNRALMNRYFGNEAEEKFYQEIQQEFKNADDLLTTYYRNRKDPALAERNQERSKLADEKLKLLETMAYQLDLQMSTEIRRGSVGDFQPEG